MKRMISELYYGKINPIEKGLVSQEYENARRLAAEYEDKLRVALKGEQVEWLEQLLCAEGDVIEMTAKEMFAEGFQLGARLMLEIMDADVGMLDKLSIKDTK